MIAAAIPDAILLPTDECFAQEVPEPVYAGLTCPLQQLSQQDIRRLTGGMRCRFEAVIQARRGYTQY
jgi:hypothetical protein